MGSVLTLEKVQLGRVMLGSQFQNPAQLLRFRLQKVGLPFGPGDWVVIKGLDQILLLRKILQWM
jgi:hypothetical protein